MNWKTNPAAVKVNLRTRLFIFLVIVLKRYLYSFSFLFSCLNLTQGFFFNNIFNIILQTAQRVWSVSKLWKVAVIIQTNFNLPQRSKAWDKRGRFCTGGWNHLEINFISQECLLKLNKFIATVSYKYPYNCYIYFYRIAFFLIIMS